MKIGIFGGTFNPVHNGHIDICKHLKEKLNFDFIYIVPTYKTPGFKFDPERIDPIHRLKMVEAAVKETKLKWLKVSKIEFEKKDISYTYLTIEHFRKTYPKADLYFILGNDRYITFDTWKNPNSITTNAKLVVYKRGHHLMTPTTTQRLIYVDDKPFNISSTDIIANLEWNKIPLASRKYISKHHLYLKTLAFRQLGVDRYKHTIAVAINAKRLAEISGYRNPQKAYDVGLAHDLFKNFDEKWQVDYIHMNSDYLIPPGPTLHSYTADIWFRKEYLMKDEEFLSAIRKHSLCALEMSQLDKLIYVADKTSMDRITKSDISMRRLAYSNLDLTFKKLFKQYCELILNKNNLLFPDTRELYDNLFIEQKKEVKTYGNFKKLS
ncbi:MAG: nicotinate (nicotinamide) nucleotide adenylyltransferase [Mycoplasmataceae bacterium]|nr:nicotinate (nicotinamide) nucleotide adenylyltransferase [Mycoplasmataceae bacterium]